MKYLHKLLKIFLIFIPLMILASCQRNSTELIVESDTDHYTIQEVYMRKAGTLTYNLVWSASNSGIKWTHANISCDPGSYHVYVKMLYYDLITTYATSISYVTVSEGESKFVYVRGLQLCQ